MGTDNITIYKRMSVEIKQIEKGELYTVNGKEVYKDADGFWVSRQEFTAAEHAAFAQYRAADKLKV